MFTEVLVLMGFMIFARECCFRPSHCMSRFFSLSTLSLSGNLHFGFERTQSTCFLYNKSLQLPLSKVDKSNKRGLWCALTS